MLNVVLGEGAWRCHSWPFGVCAASVRAHGKTNAESYFRFSPFFIKAKIFGFLSVSGNRY